MLIINRVGCPFHPVFPTTSAYCLGLAQNMLRTTLAAPQQSASKLAIAFGLHKAPQNPQKKLFEKTSQLLTLNSQN